MDYGTVIDQKLAPHPPRADRVIDEALERNWIKAFDIGQYIYGREWTSLVRLLQTKIVERAQRLDFEEWILPRYIPREALDSFKLTQFSPDLLLSAGQQSFLDPVQCISFYQFFRDSQLPRDELPFKVVEVMGGWTWRNEKAEDLDGPYRAKEFLRVEHVYCGTPEQVKKTRRSVRESLTDFLTRLELGWQVVVGHGCMDIPSIDDARLNAIYADDIPILDIEVPIRKALNKLPPLPEPGMTKHQVLSDGVMEPTVSDASYWDHDELCGCSVEGNHLTRDFGISDDRGETLWSGCCGIGLNRLVLALLYQHGFDCVKDVVLDAVSE